MEMWRRNNRYIGRWKKKTRCWIYVKEKKEHYFYTRREKVESRGYNGKRRKEVVEWMLEIDRLRKERKGRKRMSM